jgi:tRNA(fMet)-specific endonuclease VapC
LYLWDTQILRHYGEGNENLFKHLQKTSRQEVTLPSVVAAEILRGRADFALKAAPEQLPLAHATLLQTIKLLDDFQIIAFNEKCAEKMRELQKKFQTKKRYADLMIAAIALSENYILITRNTKHFADILPARQLENWIDE